jgi:hypothetical protein
VNIFNSGYVMKNVANSVGAASAAKGDALTLAAEATPTDFYNRLYNGLEA